MFFCLPVYFWDYVFLAKSKMDLISCCSYFSLLSAGITDDCHQTLKQYFFCLSYLEFPFTHLVKSFINLKPHLSQNSSWCFSCNLLLNFPLPLSKQMWSKQHFFLLVLRLPFYHVATVCWAQGSLCLSLVLALQCCLCDGIAKCYTRNVIIKNGLNDYSRGQYIYDCFSQIHIILISLL